MNTARQLTPSRAPVVPGRQRREDREAHPPTHHEKLRFAVIKDQNFWLNEYRDGVPEWGGPQGAALFSDERAAQAIAHELQAEVVNVLMKNLEGDA